MFGENPVLKQDLSDGKELRVVKDSPFYTIQGEGPFAGHPCVFVRLHGCNLRCWFCDTNFSDPNDPVRPALRLAREVYDMAHLKRDHAQVKLVVITGGEPFRQNIVPFCGWLLGMGMTVQIETAGTLWIDGFEDLFQAHSSRLHIVVSPKTPVVHPMIEIWASAYKYVVAADTNIGKDHGGRILCCGQTQVKGAGVKPLASAPLHMPVYLSPMDEYDEAKNKLNRQRVLNTALEHGVIAGLQMHKIFDVVEPT